MKHLPEDTPDEELKELIREALKANIEVNKKKISKRRLNSALSSTLSEFLSNYIVIGYDMDGSPVVFRSNKTEMENEALKSLFIKYFTTYVYNYEDF